jgi:GDPmannose 4,6-dehydratase
VLAAAGRLDAVIHLAGQSSVAASWKAPLETFDVNARLATALIYEVAKHEGVALVHASSAEIFGGATTATQNEGTPIAPVSPYGVAKAAAHASVRVARDALRAPMSNLIYLGESERRAPTFVFRKITRGLAAVALGRVQHLSLGNTSIVRDFCHADDLTAAACLLALGATPGDYICASGEGHSIAEVAHAVCGVLGLDPDQVLRTDPSLYRSADAPSLVGDASRLRALGWKPAVGFSDLVERIARFDLAALRDESQPHF